MEGIVGRQGDDEIAETIYKVDLSASAINMQNLGLNPSDTNKLVCMKGLVIRATPVIET